MSTSILSLTSFRHFVRGSRQYDISVNPASIQFIHTQGKSTTTENGTFHATVIHLANTSIKVAQSREYIEHCINSRGVTNVNRHDDPEEYIQDTSQRSVAK
jgi:hypothetical protein